MSKDELLDLLEAYEILIGLYEKDKKKNKVKKIKEIKSQKNLSIKILCLISNIVYSTFFKYCNDNIIVGKRYKPDKKQIIKKIKEIYFKSNKTFGVRRIHQSLKNKGYTISFKAGYKYMVELKFKSIIRSENKRRIDIKNKRDNTPNILKWILKTLFQ